MVVGVCLVTPVAVWAVGVELVRWVLKVWRRVEMVVMVIRRGVLRQMAELGVVPRGGCVRV